MRKESLPEGWKKERLENVASIQTGLAKNQNSQHDVIELPYLRVANVQDGFLDLSEVKTIEVRKGRESRYMLEVGDVLLTEGGDFDKLGRGAVWDGQIRNCIHQNHIFVVRTQKNKLLPSFLSAQTGSFYGKRYFLSCSKQSTNLASINSTQLKAFPVLLPPLPEQNAITDLLSAWDEAIEKTERLIQAKEKHFKGLLHESISKPQKGTEKYGWTKVKLGEIGEIKKGKGITKADLTEKGIPCIRYAEIYTDYHNNVSECNCFVPDDVFGAAFEIIKGDIIFAASGETQEEIGKCVAYLGSTRACTGGDTLVLRSQIDSYDPMFLGFALNHPSANKQKSAYAHGNSVVHLYAKDLLKVEVLLPLLEIQKKIAKILFTAQHEIDLLKQLAEKYKTQKRGLMQKMLTGEWRVESEIVNQYTEA